MDFEGYLEELADTSVRLKVADLARLSALSAEQADLLAAAWPRIDANRRREVVQELLDLAEDNVEFDFDAVFLRGLEDSDAEVRLGSVRGLWEHEEPDLIATLARLTKNDEDAAVRAESALGLGRFVLLFEEGRLRERHFREAEAALRDVISNKDEIPRGAGARTGGDRLARRALGATGDQRSVRERGAPAEGSGGQRHGPQLRAAMAAALAAGAWQRGARAAIRGRHRPRLGGR